jgi:hypothetical protein
MMIAGGLMAKQVIFWRTAWGVTRLLTAISPSQLCSQMASAASLEFLILPQIRQCY